MRQVFLSVDGRLRDTWREAFPGLTAGQFVGQLDTAPVGPTLFWVLLPVGESADVLAGRLRRNLAGYPLVVLADEPSEGGAMAALAAGAAGYCNGHAAPQVLRQVAMAVENGGVWVGQGLMQRLLAATTRLLP